MIPEALIAKARDVRIESELARRGITLKRQSRIWLAGPCPVCGGRNRFFANTKKQLWGCRYCDVGGDIVRLVQHLDGLTFPAAVRLLAGEGEERPQARPPGPSPPQDDEATRKAALAIWQQARDPRNTIVQQYLRSRGLELPDDAAEVIRFHPHCTFGGGEPRRPCMIALVRNIETNAAQGIHRTALNEDGTCQRDADGNTARLSLGSIHGGAIKLTADENVTLCLGVGEGLETALSMRLRPEFGPSPVWSLVCAGGFTWLPVLPGIETLWIAIDNDRPDKKNDRAGQRRGAELARQWAVEGREVLTMMSSVEGEDLNDVVRGK
jgi:hypothetical protein